MWEIDEEGERERGRVGDRDWGKRDGIGRELEGMERDVKGESGMGRKGVRERGGDREEERGGGREIWREEERDGKIDSKEGEK